MTCDFVKDLSRLRKQSLEAVENTEKFDEFKKYMHVTRPVEADLKKLLRRIKESSSRKCLVLLCGSAGDGKSHLISYLKNCDIEGLLDEYYLYNDATESIAPTLTSIDTLTEKLAMFNDENLQNDDKTKMILAINLGTLNNFIESEKGKKFTELRKYIERKNIFLADVYKDSFEEKSNFQYISFADYQLFTLKKDGIGTEYLENIFEKVFKKDSNNPFYNSYLKNKGCNFCALCPVRHNYEFLCEKKNQKVIIKHLTEVVIKNKTILSTRDIFNFIYDILVSSDFDDKVFFSDMSNKTKYFTDYISATTPMLLYEYKDISALINVIKNYDPLKTRSEAIDLKATIFHTIDDIRKEFEDATNGTPYSKLCDFDDILKLGSIKDELKRDILKFLIRIMELKNANCDYLELEDKVFNMYIKYLYLQNTHMEKELGELYTIAKKAILTWNGDFGSNNICIDSADNGYWILEQLCLSPKLINNDDAINCDELTHFSLSLNLRYENTKNKRKYEKMNIDYSLFKIILAMSGGYKPTIHDKNLHADFVGFVEKLIEFGDKENMISIIQKNRDSKEKFSFEHSQFGYEFKVVNHDI
jgi:DNA phosphorothioation-dependent restriction protein DptF